MYCSRLSILQELLNDDQIQRLDTYFSSLIGNAKNSITVSKVMQAVGISSSLASKVLTKCKEEEIVNTTYAYRCPKCQILLKKVDSIGDIPDEMIECYGCNEEVEITLQDVEVLYSICDESVFITGQQEKGTASARIVAPEDSLESIILAGGINEHLFHPTEEEYNRLSEMYVRIKSRQGTTKKIGDTLENFVKELFGLCSMFNVSGLRTSTNQIDCCVRNKLFLNYGIFRTIGPWFFIECKNESQTPSGGYLSKLHSIISFTNAGGKGTGIKFGIIVSKERGPSTYKTLAVKSYLADGIIIISIHGEELKAMLDARGNLLELIERKISEVVLDATTDLKESGLYSD